jgi:mxaJ protein
MSFRFVSCVLLSFCFPVLAGSPVLRVCSDPNNLPFSNEQQQGFENRIADLIAHDLGETVEYTWWSMRRGFVRNALNEHACDVVMSITSDSDMVLTTNPYYRSTYVFASRKDRALHLQSLNDERFSKWKIGVHLVGKDLAPPANALAARGIAANFVPFLMYGPVGELNTPAKLIDAVANKQVDVAIVWGPLAGYFATKTSAALDVVPVKPERWGELPFTFNVSAGVRKGDTALQSQLNKALQHQCAAIQTVLTEYGVPQPAEGQIACANSH